MRCLVGVLAFALLAFGGTQAAWAVNLIDPVICNKSTSALTGDENACGSGDAGYTVPPASGTVAPNTIFTQTPLAATRDGGAFDILNGEQIVLAPGQMTTVRLQIRHFERVWNDPTQTEPFLIDGPVQFVAGGGTTDFWLASVSYNNNDDLYTVPINVSVSSQAVGLAVQVTDVVIADSSSAAGTSVANAVSVGGTVPAGAQVQGSDFESDVAGRINSIQIVDATDDTVLDSTPTDILNGFRLNDFLDETENPGGAPLDLLEVAAVGDLQLVINDAQTPRSFDIEFKLTALEAPAQVPLPAAAWLFLSGVGALMGFRRFRNKA